MEYYGNGRSIHLAEFSVEDVLPYRTSKKSTKEYAVGDKTYSVKMASQRYHVFAESLSCACCGLVGSKMVLDITLADFKKNGRPHFNLYAVYGDYYILMTKDHIEAKAHGGKNRISNYQTMCCLCNSAKSDHKVTIDELRSFESVAERIKKIKEQ